jgi:Subtilase family
VNGNVVVVAAAANETGVSPSGGASVWYPAAYPGVLAVASAPPDGSPAPNAARGKWISIAAPGTALMTVTRGGRGYVVISGTSFAPAIVSGTVVSPVDRGAVPLQQVKAAPGGDSHATVLAVAAVLAARALLVGLGTRSVRVGRRRSWHPGAVPTVAADERVAEPRPAELG